MKPSIPEDPTPGAGPDNILRADPDTLTSGLYVHIPFCVTKCPYCDFYSVTDLAGAERFFKALRLEARMRRHFPGPFGTLYIGGGTPSAVAPEMIKGMIDNLRAVFDFEKDAEITIEANPDGITPRALDSWLEAGINRLSIGVQSFEDEVLKFLGRRHDAASAVSALENARKAGFGNIGIDLIMGFAGHTPQKHLESLERALSFDPEHLSCYQLTVEEGTPIAIRAASGEPVTADEDTQADIFLEGSEFLSSRGYTHYEVSNFARGPENFSRHNSRYWLRVPYLGLGPGAHSFAGRERSWNDPSVEGYTAALECGSQPSGTAESISPDQERLERLMFGFRTIVGIQVDVLPEISAGVEGSQNLLSRGLITIEGRRIIPTTQGMLLADRLPTDFALNEQTPLT